MKADTKPADVRVTTISGHNPTSFYGKTDKAPYQTPSGKTDKAPYQDVEPRISRSGKIHNRDQMLDVKHQTTSFLEKPKQRKKAIVAEFPNYSKKFSDEQGLYFKLSLSL